jgi:hypothetical protein
MRLGELRKGITGLSDDTEVAVYVNKRRIEGCAWRSLSLDGYFELEDIRLTGEEDLVLTVGREI